MILGNDAIILSRDDAERLLHAMTMHLTIDLTRDWEKAGVLETVNEFRQLVRSETETAEPYFH